MTFSSATLKTHTRFVPATLFLIGFLACITGPCSAMYDFEGIALKAVATGEVTGDVTLYGEYGLQDPPVTLEFEAPDTIQMARTYIGVWGGTPRYTGWAGITVNNGTLIKTSLFGKDDRNENVYVTGYGVYWIAYDTTKLVRPGHNTIVATTSRSDPDNKLDGRIYTIVTVLVSNSPRGSTTRYWLYEGNENLHGEGWSGENPTRHDDAVLTIPVTDTSDLSSAWFSILELATAKGQPDYLQFNGKDLGKTVTDTTHYPAGAIDIGDETTLNAGIVQAPQESRYADYEVFDVLTLIKNGNNDVKFQRGRDLDGDGEITTSGEKPEGEDYIHPVFALLVLKKPRTGVTGPDLMVEKVTVIDAYEGSDATITAMLQNLGTPPGSPATVRFLVDGTEIAKKEVAVDKSGIQQVSAPWSPAAGTHTVQVEADVIGDTNTSNNRAGAAGIVVGTLPDLVVSIGTPTGEETGTQQKSGTLPGIAVAACILAVIGVLYRRPPGTSAPEHRIIPAICISLLVINALFSAFPPVSAAGDTIRSYPIPVTIKNIGGSDAGAFSVTIYLDGEKVVTRQLPEGLGAGKEVSAEITIHTIPGAHDIRVIVDEEAAVRDANRGNNQAGKHYVFS